MPTVDDAAVQRAVEEVAAAVAHQDTEPQMNHARVHEFGHGEAVRVFKSFCKEDFSENLFSFSEFFSSSPDLRSKWS